MLVQRVSDHLPTEQTPLVFNQSSNTASNNQDFSVGLKEIFFGSVLNIFLPCIPLAVVARFYGWNDSTLLALSLLGLLSASERLGYITRQLAIYTNPTIGTILNASFGNLSEIVIAISGLFRGYLRLVQLLIIGSLLVNLLLMLGVALLFGGLYYKYQLFSKIASQMNMTLLILASMCFLYPTMLDFTSEETATATTAFSRVASLLLIILYFSYLYFQLASHAFLYETDRVFGYDKLIMRQKKSLGTRIDEAKNVKLKGYRPRMDYLPTIEEENEDQIPVEQELDILGYSYSVLWLIVFAASTILLSDTIALSIEGAASESKVSGVFLAGVILPIMGDFAEGASCVRFAFEGNLDLVVNVAIGSSTQLALVVLPSMVILSWCLGQQLSFDLGLFESLAVFIAIIGVTFVIKDGVSNYMLGVALIACYAAVAVGFFAELDESLTERHRTSAANM